MRYKKVLIVLCAILFFLAALTSYINRVVFPRLVKKIAVERIEEVLKRKVEIGSIHFNWIRGFVIDKIKIYEKASHDAVFAQADQVSFGIIFFPGPKHYRITIPFINVRSPSVHLIRTGIDTWNFSDMYAPGPATASSWEIAWGGITISDGKFLVDDASAPRAWSEFFDNINLNLSLSYKGISYDFTADIPAKKGFIGAIVYYQPVTQNTQAQIHLKNIDTASYLSLINIPDVHLDSGVIKEVRLNINHTQGKTFAQGDVFIKNLDVTSHEQSFKGDIEIRDLDAQYQSGNLSARGQMTLNNVQAAAPGFSAGGSAQARVNDFELTREGATFLGSLHAQNIFMDLEDRQAQADEVVLDNIKIRKDKDGIQSVGSIMTKGLLVQWPDQKVQGDITLKAMTLRMKDEDDIALEGDLQADHFSASIDDKNISSQRVLLENIRLSILDQENVTLNTKLSLDDVTITAGKNILICAASIKTDKLFFNLDDDIIKVSAILNSSKGKMVLDNHKTIEADPRLDLTLQMSLSAPEELVYKGSVTFSDARILGFVPVQSLDNVELDADFQNDAATINALSANILDTNLRVNGTVKNFENPILNITAEADELNLAKIKDLIPQMADQYGLTFDGTGRVKVRFIGLATSPLTGDLLVTASVKNGSVSSSPFHQRIKNITGIVEATADSLKWRDFSAVYEGQKYALTGSVDDFKNPKILTTIDGPNFQIKADIAKNNNLFTINAPMVRLMGYSLTDIKININQAEGKVKNLTFDGKLYDGTVHAVGSLDLAAKGIGYDLALNIDNTDMHKWKIDSPLKMDEIDGKFFLTVLAHGTVADFKNNLHAAGSLAIRDGFLAEFNLFKGLLSVLNDALRLGQVQITDVESNFTIENQRINTDNLRLKGPTIVLLGKGWVNFDELCDLHVTVDLSSGAVPAVAHNVLDTLNIHIYDKVTNPKFKRKISMPQVINSLLKNLLQ